jgi:hypothetical protein
VPLKLEEKFIPMTRSGYRELRLWVQKLAEKRAFFCSSKLFTSDFKAEMFIPKAPNFLLYFYELTNSTTT